MAVTKYTYGIAADTVNGSVDGTALTKQIDNSAIATAVDHIATNDDVLDIYMADALSGGDSVFTIDENKAASVHRPPQKGNLAQLFLCDHAHLNRQDRIQRPDVGSTEMVRNKNVGTVRIDGCDRPHVHLHPGRAPQGPSPGSCHLDNPIAGAIEQPRNAGDQSENHGKQGDQNAVQYAPHVWKPPHGILPRWISGRLSTSFRICSRCRAFFADSRHYRYPPRAVPKMICTWRRWPSVSVSSSIPWTAVSPG